MTYRLDPDKEISDMTDNELIAEFMGLKKDVAFSEGHGKPMYKVIGSVSNLRYHNSWDWLMPVISKIKKLDVAIQLISNKNCCIHNFDQGFEYEFEYEFEQDFTPVYDAVVAFIKWHNGKKEEETT